MAAEKGSFKFIDNSAHVKKDIALRSKGAIEAGCLIVVSYVKAGAPVDTGRLRSSIDHIIKANSAGLYEGWIGTNVIYAIYVEYGTGEFAENGRGRRGYWVYVSGSGGGHSIGSSYHKTYSLDQAMKAVAYLKKKGLDAHLTHGMKGTKFLRHGFKKASPAVKEVLQKYFRN